MVCAHFERTVRLSGLSPLLFFLLFFFFTFLAWRLWCIRVSGSDVQSIPLTGLWLVFSWFVDSKKIGGLQQRAEREPVEEARQGADREQTATAGCGGEKKEAENHLNRALGYLETERFALGILFGEKHQRSR